MKKQGRTGVSPVRTGETSGVSESGSIFHKVLDAFYSGRVDERTIVFLNAAKQ
jgi:hypothetical protein